MYVVDIGTAMFKNPMGVAKPSPYEAQRDSENIYQTFLQPDVDIPKIVPLQGLLLPRLVHLASFSCMKISPIPIELYIMKMLKFLGDAVLSHNGYSLPSHSICISYFFSSF